MTPRRATRIPPEFEAAFGDAEGDVPAGRVDLGDAPADAGATLQVRPQELDLMAHVNNAVYADWLEEA